MTNSEIDVLNFRATKKHRYNGKKKGFEVPPKLTRIVESKKKIIPHKIKWRHVSVSENRNEAEKKTQRERSPLDVHKENLSLNTDIKTLVTE